MGTLFYALLALLYLLLAGGLLYRTPRGPNNARFLLSLTLLGLAYDALTLALGNTLGISDLLLSLNHGRYLAHAALTPFYFVIAALLAERAELQWAGVNSRTAAWLVTVAAMLGGMAAFLLLEFTPIEAYGLLRYKAIAGQNPAWAHSFSVIVSIFVNVILIVVGAALWRVHRWPWLCLTAIVMFFASMPPVSFGFLLGSAGELLLNLALVASTLRFTAALAEEHLSSPPENK